MVFLKWFGPFLVLLGACLLWFWVVKPAVRRHIERFALLAMVGLLGLIVYLGLEPSLAASLWFG